MIWCNFQERVQGVPEDAGRRLGNGRRDRKWPGGQEGEQEEERSQQKVKSVIQIVILEIKFSVFNI